MNKKQIKKLIKQLQALKEGKSFPERLEIARQIDELKKLLDD